MALTKLQCYNCIVHLFCIIFSNMKTITFVLFLIVLSLSLVVQAQNNDDNLLLLQVLHRHGDRTPVVLYKNDHYTKADFKEGLGQMTAVGKQRLFEFGAKLKTRYPNYFGKTKSTNLCVIYL